DSWLWSKASARTVGLTVPVARRWYVEGLGPTRGRACGKEGVPLMIFIVVKFTVRPDYGDTWLDRVSAFTQATRQEPGNLWFEWSRSVEDPTQYILLEAFRDAHAGVEHVNSEHFKTAIRDQPQMLTRTPDIVNVEVPGTEWSK